MSNPARGAWSCNKHWLLIHAHCEIEHDGMIQDQISFDQMVMSDLFESPNTAQWSSRMIRASGVPRHRDGEDVRDPGSIPG